MLTVIRVRLIVRLAIYQKSVTDQSNLTRLADDIHEKLITDNQMMKIVRQIIQRLLQLKKIGNQLRKIFFWHNGHKILPSAEYIRGRYWTKQ